MIHETSESLLGAYRVLDLTDEKGLLCGRILGDLGADVIKVEQPCGDKARSIGPFYKDITDVEKSLHWFFTNLNKRSITLDIEKARGQDLFKHLVLTAHFVIESSDPGHMAGLGLGYEDLERINPHIIMTSITPYGQTGPYKDFQHSDLTTWAMAGDDEPVRGSGPRPCPDISTDCLSRRASWRPGIHGGSLLPGVNRRGAAR